MVITPENFMKDSGGANQNINERKLMSFDPEGWEKYEVFDAKALIDFVKSDAFDFSVKDTDVFYKDLPFYKNVQLVWVMQRGEEGYVQSFLKYGDEIVSLDGHFDYIVEVNETGALSLDQDNVLDYLKFVFYFTYDQEDMESSYLIENEHSEFLDSYSGYLKKRALKNYRGSRVIATAEKDSFMVEVRTLFELKLFDLKLKVFADGFYEVVDEAYVCTL